MKIRMVEDSRKGNAKEREREKEKMKRRTKNVKFDLKPTKKTGKNFQVKMMQIMYFLFSRNCRLLTDRIREKKKKNVRQNPNV